MSNDLYRCAKRSCKHQYRQSEMVLVDNGMTQLGCPTKTGTCPKCGHDKFYLVAKSSGEDL